MSFLDRASLYLSSHSDAELVAMWAEIRTDRLRPDSFVRFRTLYATPGVADVKGIKERLQATYEAMLAAPDPATAALGDKLQATYQYMMGQREDDGIDVGRKDVRDVARALTQAIVPGVDPVIPDAETLGLILAPGGSEYTWAQEDALGTAEAHFAAARVAKAHTDAVAAEHKRVTALLDAWVAARTAERAAWVAGKFAGELAAAGAFALPAAAPAGGGE